MTGFAAGAVYGFEGGSVEVTRGVVAGRCVRRDCPWWMALDAAACAGLELSVAGGMGRLVAIGRTDCAATRLTGGVAAGAAAAEGVGPAGGPCEAVVGARGGATEGASGSDAATGMWAGSSALAKVKDPEAVRRGRGQAGGCDGAMPEATEGKAVC